MAQMFVPADFQPPVEVRIGEYVMRPLTEAYAEVDLAAVNSSIDIISQARGGTWPRAVMTLEEDIVDLVNHHQEFDRRGSFAYSILNSDETECVGCVYVYPPNHPLDDSNRSGMPQDADAVVNYWATQAAYDEGFYPILSRFVVQWIQEEWPFERPYFSNRLKV